MTDFDIDEHATDVTRFVRAASRRSLEWYRQGMEVDNKVEGSFDPVTEADRLVEREIRLAIGQRFGDHAILGEEQGTTGTGPIRWTIDPIDGTRAFVIGHPMWGTLVGLQIDDEPVAGWMHQPALDETHVATPAGGFMVRGDTDTGIRRPLGASMITDLGDAVLVSTHPSMFEDGELAAGYAALSARTKMSRFGGDCANYGLLALGLVDLVVETGLAPYDIVPLIPIIRASGAIVTGPGGEAPTEGGIVVAAATPALHEAALAVLGIG